MSLVEKLPIVDRTTVVELVENRKSPLPKLMGEFDQTHSAFGAVMAGVLQPLGNERVMRVIYGALVTSVLLRHAQNRIGGIIPEEVSEDALRASLLSLVKNTDEGMRTIQDELMGVQRELFTGLRFFEHNILERTSNDCQLGGLITLLTYKHILESQELERKLGLEN